MKESLFTNGGGTIIGMVHALPLPGSAGYDGDFDRIMEQAVSDAKTLEAAGVDAVIVENMGDSPFTALMNKRQVAALTAIAVKVRDAITIPMGVDAAFCDPEAALAIAAVSGAGFIRDAVFVDTVVFTDGIIYPTANEVITLRNQLGLRDKVKILADVQVKHTQMLVPDVPIEKSLGDAIGNGADGIIVTGAACGMETPIDVIRRAKELVKVPVLAGSGVNTGNIVQQLQIADGCIVGSSLKEGGVLSNPIDFDKTKALVNAWKNR